MRRIGWIAAFAAVAGMVLGMAAFGGDAEMAGGRIDSGFNLGQLLGGKLERASQKNARVVFFRSRPPVAPPSLADEQIVGADIRTGTDVGELGGPAGIRLTPDEIAGYSSGTTKQFYLQSSDGRGYAGGGAVILDAAGVRILGEVLATSGAALRFESVEDTLDAAVFLSSVDDGLYVVTDNGRRIVVAAEGQLTLSGDGIRLTAPVGGDTDVSPALDDTFTLGKTGLLWANVLTHAVTFADGTTQTTAPSGSGSFAVDHTASEDLVTGNAVWITGSGTVGKTLTSIDPAKVAGIVAANASNGNTVSVLAGGKATVVADEAIAVGDLVRISVSTAGRVEKLTTVTSGGTGHTHTDSGHTHSVSDTTGSPSASTTAADSGHTHSTSATGASSSNLGAGHSTHYHNAVGSGNGPIGTENFAKSDHTHTVPNTGFEDKVVAVATSGHSHSVSGTSGSGIASLGTESSHTHTQSHGRLLGKALTAAAGAGSTLDILITLGG